MSTTALTVAIIIAVVLVLASVGVFILLVRTVYRSVEDRHRRPPRPRPASQTQPGSQTQPRPADEVPNPPEAP
jgi:flagellar basal body-associated protein FliL